MGSTGHGWWSLDLLAEFNIECTENRVWELLEGSKYCQFNILKLNSFKPIGDVLLSSEIKIQNVCAHSELLPNVANFVIFLEV